MQTRIHTVVEWQFPKSISIRIEWIRVCARQVGKDTSWEHCTQRWQSLVDKHAPLLHTLADEILFLVDC